ncbi:hypothetical protein BDM02DRAFT_3187559 [Thelephora ganbajun]|uniref:Uncharacterized protein n=1 Tax=Thelephora ganbajun TaxID=370292 RepID=A0ACB6ZDV9_THEGA|nr:hypothetical protein BDM02DRAFT_3187559 [Thelephora ganbajun]
MSTSVGGRESYAGRNSSVSQLLDAAKRNLQSSTFGRIATTTSQSEVDRLEQDALEVLRLVRSIKNKLAPINRIPPEVFSLIPEYWDKNDMDKNLITLTHVCHGWREVLIGHSSLWTRLDCADAEKTRVYIERSKSLPLEIALRRREYSSYLRDVFLMVMPHISRAKSINIVGDKNILQTFTEYASCPVPLLRELIINLPYKSSSALSTTLFNGDFPSLCTLSLTGVIPHLPWKNMSKLTTFELCHVMSNKISVTRLLDFFVNAPFLRDIKLDSIPDSSDAPPGRVVSLPCVKSLNIFAGSTSSSISLNHLSLPPGALLDLECDFSGEESPLPKFLPKTVENLQNVSCITSIYLVLSEEISMQIDGPSGRLSILGCRADQPGLIPGLIFVYLDRRVLRSLDYFVLSRIQRLVITSYEFPGFKEIDISSPHHILNGMSGLRTLRLVHCNNLPFILALDPNQNPSKLAVCPKLEDLILYVDKDLFNIEELTSMVKERVSRDAKLSSITIDGLGSVPEEILGLREHVARVEYRVEEEPPQWDNVFGDEKDW